MKEEYVITFYFSSGQKMIVSYSKDKLSELLLQLKRGWDLCSTASDEFGINFAQVTHYKVNEEE